MAHINRRSLLLAPFIAAGAAFLPKLSFKDWWSNLLYETFHNPTGWREKILMLHPNKDSQLLDIISKSKEDGHTATFRWHEEQPIKYTQIFVDSQEEPSDHQDV